LRQIRDGVKVDFACSPKPFKRPPIKVDSGDEQWVRDELAKQDALGAFGPAVPSAFISPAFVVHQGGKRRFVLDLRELNAQTTARTCRYETASELPSLLRPGMWLLSSDVSAAFHHLRLHPTHVKYFNFHVRVGAEVLTRSCYVLPFGWRCSPVTWTKFFRVLIKAARAHGISCLAYIDDTLWGVQGSVGQARQARDWLAALHRRAGVAMHPSKGQFDEPSHLLHDHLGLEICTAPGTQGYLRVPARRANKVRALARQLLSDAAHQRRRVSSKLLRSFAGCATSTSLAVRPARFHLRGVWDSMRESEFSVLHRAALTDLEFWAEFSYDHPANGVVLFPQGLERSIATEASGDLAWGAELLLPGFRPGRMEAHPAPERTAQGFWAGTSVEGSHITIKELKAVHFGILAFQEELRGKVVRLWEDNQAVVHIIRNGTSKAPDLMQHLRALWRDLVRLNIDLRPRYIRSALNPADRWSRLASRSDWALDRALVRKLTSGACDLDPFACQHTAQAPAFCSCRAEPGALALDGMSIAWTEATVWLNPPWGLLPGVLAKATREKTRGFVVCPEWRSASWWPALLALGGVRRRLPRPFLCVQPQHHRGVEPLMHRNLALVCVAFDAQPGRAPPSFGRS
jgi:hypothetical protein